MNSTQTEQIICYLFKERNNLSTSVLESLTNSSPIDFESVEIIDDSPKSQLTLNRKIFLDFEENYGGTSVTIRVDGKTMEHVTSKVSKNEALGKCVQFYLNRSGTTISFLNILNHPYGLESCTPLKVRNLKWNLSIASSRYDYTTWFDCLRCEPFRAVDIDWNGDDNTVFSEDVISSATQLHIKTKVPLPIQAIVNFKAFEIHLKQEMSTQDLLRLSENWIEEKKMFGTRFSGLFGTQDITSVVNAFREKFKKVLPSEYGFLVETDSGVKFKVEFVDNRVEMSVVI